MAVITSIEGVFKAELKARCVEVDYRVTSNKIKREGIEREIETHRHGINSALVAVLQRFLSIRAQARETPNPIPNFGEHFTVLCDLLRALADVARKPAGWDEEIIKAWDRIIRQRSEGEGETSELEFHIMQLLELKGFFAQKHTIAFRGRQGILHKTNCAFLLAQLQKIPVIQNSLPKNPAGFSRRLSSERFCGFEVVREGDTPELARTAKQRQVGFFVPSDDVTTNDTQKSETVMGANT